MMSTPPDVVAFPAAMSRGQFSSWMAIVRGILLHCHPFADAEVSRAFFTKKWKQLGVPKTEARAWVDQYCSKVSRYHYPHPVVIHKHM